MRGMNWRPIVPKCQIFLTACMGGWSAHVDVRYVNVD